MTNEQIENELNLIFLFKEAEESYREWQRERNYLEMEQEFEEKQLLKELNQEISS